MTNKIFEAIDNLFISRQDSYPQQIENENNYLVIRKPVTEDIILKHVRGELTIGCWQIDPFTNKVKWICFDFDGIIEEEFEKAKKLFYRLKYSGFNPVMEFSGRRGYHVWLFIEPIDVAIARQFVLEMSQGGSVSDVYPKSDKINGDGYGFQVKLPLGIHRASMKRSYLLDENLNELSQSDGEEFLIRLDEQKRDTIAIINIGSFVKVKKLPEKTQEIFIKRQLRKIVIDVKDFEKVVRIKQGIYNEVKSWSTLKLVFLNYVADVYSKIMKIYYPNKYFYIDLFSGAGIGKVIDNRNDLVFGSPLLIANKYEFAKMFFCDCNKDFSNALEERLKGLGLVDDKFSVYPEDCNSAIDKIIPQVKDGHSLIFVDPYGMEITWKSLEKILQLNADIIINFQTVDIARAKKKNTPICPTMENFFKSKHDVEEIYKTDEPNKTIGERLLELYMKDIKETRLKSFYSVVMGSIRIKKDKKFYYDLIFVTRETKGKNPWLKPIMDASNEIEDLNAKIVQQMLDVLKGRQLTLTSTARLNDILPVKK